MKSITRIRTLVISLFTTLLLTPAFGTINVWTGGVDNQWGTAGNWSLGHTPLPGEDVTVGDGFGTIDIGGNRSVQGVTVNLGASTLTNGTLQTSQTTVLTANNTVINSGGKITNPGGLALGDVTLNNVTYAADGAEWSARQNHSININGSTISMGSVLHLRGDSGQTGNMNMNNSSAFISLIAINHDSAADTGPTELHLSGGSYVAAGTLVAGLAGGGSGTLRLTDSTYEQQGGTMFLREQSRLISDNGTIVLRGTLANAMTNETQWSGNLTVAMQNFGGTIVYEVGGTDEGDHTNVDTVAGENFSIAKLYFGITGVPQSIQLTDNSNNDGLAGPEALYVGSLELLSDTTLDMNGLNLYYYDFESNGFDLTLINAGTFAEVIPEPSVAALLLIGAALLRRCRCGGR